MPRMSLIGRFGHRLAIVPLLLLSGCTGEVDADLDDASETEETLTTPSGFSIKVRGTITDKKPEVAFEWRGTKAPTQAVGFSATAGDVATVKVRRETQGGCNYAIRVLGENGSEVRAGRPSWDDSQALELPIPRKGKYFITYELPRRDYAPASTWCSDKERFVASITWRFRVGVTPVETWRAAIDSTVPSYEGSVGLYTFATDDLPGRTQSCRLHPDEELISCGSPFSGNGVNTVTMRLERDGRFFSAESINYGFPRQIEGRILPDRYVAFTTYKWNRSDARSPVIRLGPSQQR